MAATDLRNAFDGGTDGVTLTTGNSGGAGNGDAFTGVNAWVFTNAQMLDVLAIRVQNPGTNLFVIRWAMTGAAAAVRAYVYLTTLPAADVDMLHVMDTGNTISTILRVNGSGQVRLVAGGVTYWTAAATIPINQWIRLEMLATASTNSADGTARGAYYVLDDTTAIEDSGLFSGINTAGTSGAFNNARLGKNSAASYTGDIYLDNVGATYGTSGEVANYIGPANTDPPVLESGAVTALVTGYRLG